MAEKLMVIVVEAEGENGREPFVQTIPVSDLISSKIESGLNAIAQEGKTNVRVTLRYSCGGPVLFSSEKCCAPS